MLRRSFIARSNSYTPASNKIPSKCTCNIMVIKTCNMRCKMCFSTYEDSECAGLPAGGLESSQVLRLVDLLAASDRFDKITWAGGEPTLRPDLAALLERTKFHGMKTSVVTNGALFMKPLSLQVKPKQIRLFELIDQLAVSCDSGDARRRRLIGRHLAGGAPLSNEYYFALADYIHNKTQCSLKLNSVVSAHNFDEDMTDFVKTFAPLRWKVFQCLPVKNQNDEHWNEMKITEEQFGQFKQTHAALNPVCENNDDMSGSYFTIDPFGRFQQNSSGRHIYSRPILDVGVDEALKDVDFDFEKYVRRGGLYDIAQPEPKKAEKLTSL